MTSLIPLYLKTTYKNDPVFKDAKSVFSFYNNENAFAHKFEGDLFGKVKMLDIQDSMLSQLESADYEGFIKMGIQYADLAVKAGDDFSENINTLFDEISKKANLPELEENYSDTFYDLYTELAS
jgi:starch synthase